MWVVNGENLRMAEGDFGIDLPFSFSGIAIGSQDRFKFIFKDTKNGTEILTKDLDPSDDNKIYLFFTQEESSRFPIGSYVYSLDWYQNGMFLCNLILCASFKVVDKA